MRKHLRQGMKKAVSVLLTAAMTVSLCPFPAGAAAGSGNAFYIEEAKALPEDTAHRSVALGTTAEAVEKLLPSKLTVRGRQNTVGGV